MAINEFRSEVLNRPIDGARYHWQTGFISRRCVRLKIVPLSEQIVPFVERCARIVSARERISWHDIVRDSVFAPVARTVPRALQARKRNRVRSTRSPMHSRRRDSCGGKQQRSEIPNNVIRASTRGRNLAELPSGSTLNLCMLSGFFSGSTTSRKSPASPLDH